MKKTESIWKGLQNDKTQRNECPYPTVELNLRKLQPDAAYRVVFRDNIIEGNPLTS